MEIEWVSAKEDYQEGIYDIDTIEEYQDEDAISSEEAAFMAGYLTS